MMDKEAIVTLWQILLLVFISFTCGLLVGLLLLLHSKLKTIANGMKILADKLGGLNNG